MEILIKGMDMPETCIDCPLHDGEYGQCNINHNIYISFDDRPRKCPLIEINSHYLIDANLPSAQPEKRYLRLIDVDNLIDDCRRYLATLNPDRDGKEYTRIHWLIGVLNNAPSVNPDTPTDCISRQAAIDLWEKYHPTIAVDAMQYDAELRQLPSAQPETYKEKLNEIASALSEKFAYMNTCPNERDIILGYLGVKRCCNTHCNTDCTNTKCESHPLSSAQLEIIRCKDCKHRGEKPIADGRYWCEIHDTFMYYCSDADRRTDEND